MCAILLRLLAARFLKLHDPPLLSIRSPHTQIAPAVQALPLRDTLVCQLLTAWLLKLPVWPGDVVRDASTGAILYLAAPLACRGLLAPPLRLLPRALRAALPSAQALLEHAQRYAAAHCLAVPEVNIGALLPLRPWAPKARSSV